MRHHDRRAGRVVRKLTKSGTFRLQHGNDIQRPPPRGSSWRSRSVPRAARRAWYIPVRMGARTAAGADQTSPERGGREIIINSHPAVAPSRAARCSGNSRRFVLVARNTEGRAEHKIRHASADEPRAHPPRASPSTRWSQATYSGPTASTTWTPWRIGASELPLRMISFEELVGRGKNRRAITEVPLDAVTKYSAEDADMTLPHPGEADPPCLQGE